jgi:Chaperone of endosialidase
MNPKIHLDRATPSRPLVALVLICLALAPLTRAVVPPPDGGYPGFNTAEGQKALFGRTTGVANTAVGWYSLFSNTDGSYNTAVGAGTLLFNVGDQTTGDGTQNTAIGTGALLNNTTGAFNTANGAFALFGNTQGGINTANGAYALYSNTQGSVNTAIGLQALFSNTTGNQNTANGASALHDNNTGGANTALGNAALRGNTNGFFNTAIGDFALANSTGNGNTALGSGAGNGVTTANNVICIRALGENVDNSCFIANIYENVQPIVGTDPDSVTITTNGRLGRGNVSSRRYKHDIQPMDKASEVLYTLKPVSFRYNKEYDATQTLAFGLIAEEVAEVYPDLVGRNPNGEPESVRYEQINAMLLNEFLKEHKKVEEQQATIAQLESNVAKQEATTSELKKDVGALTAQLKEQGAQIQRVSARIEVSKAVGQTALNNP